MALKIKKRGESLIIFLLIGILIASAIYLNTRTGKAIRSNYLTNDGNLCNNLDSYTKLTAVQQRELLNYIPKNDPKNLCAKSPSAIKLGGLTGCFADLNNDGVVNSADLPILLGAWGPCNEVCNNNEDDDQDDAIDCNDLDCIGHCNQ